MKKHLELARRLGYEFATPCLLEEALHHASVKSKMKNERLEFLGDRVLGLVIAEHLYKNFPNEQEGDMAQRLSVLVSRQSCMQVAQKFDMASALMLDKGSRLSRHSENVLADTCEAVIAAIYLDGGLEAAREFILRGWHKILTEMVDVPVNAKSALQEYATANGYGVPNYEKTGQDGLAHEPIISVRVQVDGGHASRAADKSRKAAEMKAAEKLLAKLKEL